MVSSNITHRDISVRRANDKNDLKQRLLKIGQPRDTGNIGYTRHMMKTNETHTPLHRKMSNTDPTKTSGVNQVPASYKTPILLLIKSGKSLGDFHW